MSTNVSFMGNNEKMMIKCLERYYLHFIAPLFEISLNSSVNDRRAFIDLAGLTVRSI
jgi:hypothetical protein